MKLVSVDEIISVIKNSDKNYLLLAFLLVIPNIYIQFRKWELLSKTLLSVRKKKKIWQSLFFGFTAGVLTPVRVGEYVGRKYPYTEITLMKVTIATLVDHFSLLYLVLFVGSLVSGIFVIQFYNFLFALPFFLTFIFLLILALLLVSGYKFSSKKINMLADRFSFIKKLKTELGYVREINIKTFMLLMLFSLLHFTVVVLQYSVLGLAFGTNGSIFDFIIAGIIILFTKSILSFLSFADLGIREGTSVYVLSKLGYSKAIGFNSAIFLFLLNLIIPSIIGLVLFLTKKED